MISEYISHVIVLSNAKRSATDKVRILYDRDQPTARLVVRSKDDLDNPLNMTHCYLRAMSPIHLKCKFTYHFVQLDFLRLTRSRQYECQSIDVCCTLILSRLIQIVQFDLLCSRSWLLVPYGVSLLVIPTVLTA